MKIEILMSTMNKKCIEDLELDKKQIFNDCLIINQVTDENIELKNEEILERNIRMLSFREKGLSKSRNRALENARGEVCLIADDDLVIKKEYIYNILESFEKNSEYDVITFQSELPEGGLRKKYSKNAYKHNMYTVTKTSSIEIAFKRKSVIEKNIKFDERFGCGAEFPAGEEVIFLRDCYKEKLKLKYVPQINSCHEIESTGNKINKEFTEEILKFKGAFAKRLFPKNYNIIIYGLYFKFLVKGKIKIRDLKWIKLGAKEIINKVKKC